MQLVNSEIRTFLQTKPSEQQLTDFINRLQPASVKPTLRLHQADLASIKEPTVVSAHLMVQDVREVYYYVSLAIEKGFQEDSPFFLYKYGNVLEHEPEDVQDGGKYLHVMTDRFPVICTPVRYQTDWARSLEGSVFSLPEILLEVDGQAEYRLGEVINVVALYDPHLQKLFMIRNMSAEEAEQEGLQVLKELASKEISVEQTRQELMGFLCNYCSQTFAEYLLAAMVTQECMFLGCEANLAPLVSELLPRVAHIKLVHPCNTSLFPFKNQQGELKIAPMQLSNLRTFIILDLSQFSSQKQVTLQGIELQNFSALKMFVEEGKTIYRWEIGESHVPHTHVGLIVKATKLITPHFNPKDQKISPDLTVKLPEGAKMRMRQYLQRVISIDPKLDDDERKLIQKELASQKNKQRLATDLGNIMKMSKLLARTHGRSFITFQDFIRSRELIEVNQ